MITETPVQQKKITEVFGHPRGLFILFFTEMWERFSYYGMRAILVLYMVEKTNTANPGLGWSNGRALMLYGWYTMLVYIASIPGGLVADYIFGQRKTVTLGAVFLVIGHSILAINLMWTFYTGIAFIVIGVGLLKANISAMVGGLYRKDDIRRDNGFTIFYIGTSIGALLATFSVGYVGERIGWHYGFSMAGVAMVLGLIVYLRGQKFLKGIEALELIQQKEDRPPITTLFADIFRYPGARSIFILLLTFSVYWIFFQSVSYGILFIFISAVIGVLMMVYRSLETRISKDKFLVIIYSLLIIVVFWSAFEQAGGLLTLYARNNTDRLLPPWIPFVGGGTVPATWFQALNPIFIILFGTLIANFWMRRKLKKKESSSLFKMGIGIIIVGFAFLFMLGASFQLTVSKEKASMLWLLFTYMFLTIGELVASPVALSFVTKLAPPKYASLMMGVYFSSWGFGNKLAGVIGEFSQKKPIQVEWVYQYPENRSMDPTGGNNHVSELENTELNTLIFADGDHIRFLNEKDGRPLEGMINFIEQSGEATLLDILLSKEITSSDNAYHGILSLNTFALSTDNKSAGTLSINEIQMNEEVKTFILLIFITTLAGLTVILFLKPLKRLTHGIEDNEK